jgi:hypothetical protein
MRVAFVGLSTPLIYDIGNPASPTSANRYFNQNPVLESAFGLLLLFDEIWFLCRALCPENMRGLSYVKFLDESGLLPNITDIAYWNSIDVFSDPNISERYSRNLEKTAGEYNSTRIFLDRLIPGADTDNHRHVLSIGGREDLVPSSAPIRLDNILFDLEVIKRIGRKDVELITNSGTQWWFDSPNNPILQAKLVELLTIGNIPNYLSSKGPYHPCVEDVRNSPYLQSFRTWLTQQSSNVNQGEVEEVTNTVEAELKEAQEHVFLKYLDSQCMYTSTAKIVAGIVADILIPNISSVIALAEATQDYFSDKDKRWQGFIISTRRLARKEMLK